MTTRVSTSMLKTVSSKSLTSTSSSNEGQIVQLDANGKVRSALLPTGSVIQVVNVTDGAYDSGTTVFVNDDTIPQNTEGNEFMTLAITPTSASSKLKIEVVCVLSTHTDNHKGIVALFQDSTANALAAVMNHDMGGQGRIKTISFNHYMTAGTTSATTFKVRAGSETAGTVGFNGYGGSRYFGGVMASSITITEIGA